MEESLTLNQFWLNFHDGIKDLNPVKGMVDKVFRGQSQNYPLLPSIVRGLSEGAKIFFDCHEPNVISEFKRGARAFLTNREKPSCELEWMVLAQHYGCPTRLLDWTTNPLVALFFASETHDDNDGVIHIVEDSMIEDRIEYINLKTCYVDQEINSSLVIQPTVADTGTFIRPPYEDQRYLNQSTVLFLGVEPFNEPSFRKHRKLIVPHHLKADIRNSLREMGVSAYFIYPGLEGVARDIKMHVCRSQATF
ncbi:FRG domain-containing protein [Marinomonas sp. TI.3.20]|uniref:FRG domain-containing protein n=1 Tax=Marinomonas sp. TI.3.20 TaxID=3121296 RepID=UPI00311E093E